MDRQRSNRRLTAILAIAVLALALAGCGAVPAAAPAVVAPAASAMSDTPQTITARQYNDQFVATDTEHLLVDVRTPEEFSSGHIKGAVNIPVQELSQRLDEVAIEKPVVLYCRSGNRSAQAATILDQAGYSGVYDLGGIGDWQSAGYPVE
jgi:rhodanese-related sulfurtransferase